MDGIANATVDAVLLKDLVPNSLKAVIRAVVTISCGFRARVLMGKTACDVEDDALASPYGRPLARTVSTSGCDVPFSPTVI